MLVPIPRLVTTLLAALLLPCVALSQTAKVVEAYRWPGASAKAKQNRTVALGDTLAIEVSNLATLVSESTCQDEDGNTIQDCKQQGIALFLDGKQIKGLVPDNDKGRLLYHLDHTTDSEDTWADLLGDPPLDHRFWERPTRVSVGLENGLPIESNATFNLVRIRQGYFWSCSVLFLLLLAALIWLALSTDLLRDSGPNPAQGLKPFSLARCQMAFWFVIVVGSFLFIWLVTGDLDILNTSTLVLIGIGSGTALGAAVIDAGNAKEAAAAGNPPAPKKSVDFLRDLLNDAAGISFHRFQMLVWTLVLAVIFFYGAWHRLEMPEFSATLLALQGISAGTYLGFKIPEQR